MVDDKGSIFKITSNYCLKSILSYIDYSTVLKLVKYNKCFQKKLDINIKDYSLDYEIKTGTIKMKDFNYRDNKIYIKMLPLLIGF